MLQAQVNYWTFMEGKRHNLATEEQARNELAESIRHNVISEGFNRFSVHETRRHNLASEQLGFINASEVQRANRAQERIGQANANTNRLAANIQAQKVGFDNINTQYANRTARMNAYNNEANTIVRQQELLLKQKQYNLDVAEMPANYIRAFMPGLTSLASGKGDVVRKVTKTRTRTIKSKK